MAIGFGFLVSNSFMSLVWFAQNEKLAKSHI